MKKSSTLFIRWTTACAVVSLGLAVAAADYVVKAPNSVKVLPSQRLGDGEKVIVQKGAQIDLNMSDGGRVLPLAKQTIYLAGEGPDGRGALINGGRMPYNSGGSHVGNLVLTDDATVGGARFDQRQGTITGDYWLTVKNKGAEASDVFAVCEKIDGISVKGIRVTDGGNLQLCMPRVKAPAGIELSQNGGLATWSAFSLSKDLAVTVSKGGGRIFSDAQMGTYLGPVTVTAGNTLRITNGTWNQHAPVCFAGTLVNDGVIDVTAATLFVSGKVTGRGVFRATGGRLDLSEADLSGFKGKIEGVKDGRVFLPDLDIRAKFASLKDWQPGEWPVVRRFDGDHLSEISMPMGGIGTGCVGLGGRGELRDWQIKDKPDRGAPHDGNCNPFFAVWAKPANGRPFTRMLAGPLTEAEYSSNSGRGNGSNSPNFGLPRFQSATFEAAYPFGVANLASSNLPIRARVKGFNPFIPGDAEASGLPIAVLTYEIENLTDAPMEVSVAGAMRNLAGEGGHTFRSSQGFKGIYSSADGQNSVCLGVATDGKVSARLGCEKTRWNGEILQLWDDITDDGELTLSAPVGHSRRPLGALAVKKTLAARAKASFTFYVTWYFPAKSGWSSRPEKERNWYSTRYHDAWNEFLLIAPRIPELEKRTRAFASAFAASSLPTEVKDAALSTAAVLKSPTVFRIASGHLMVYEGTGDNWGSCDGNCTHVWNYEYATAYLFGELARSMRDVELVYAMEDDGKTFYRSNLPLGTRPRGHRGISITAADGQMGTLLQTYREWQLSGDDAFLKKYYPLAKKALAFAWKPEAEAGWDVDRDGLMEGAQFNTMDCWYYGPNPLCEFWYLGALRAGEEMAKAMGDTAFAAECRRLFESGRALTDKMLFNGSFYKQIVYMPNTKTPVDPTDPKSGAPDLQVGEGCEADALAGQNMAWTLGLGDLANRANIKKNLETVATKNYLADFSDHFTNMRGYAMGNDAGLMNTYYPDGKRPLIPYPYYCEAWTGIEYTAAAGMNLVGMDAEALRTVRDVRNRHNGSRRNPFSEPECGHYYARSMAAWSLVVTWPGFQYSAPSKTMSFAAKDGTWFWSTGGAFGTATIRGANVSLNVIEGRLPKGLKVVVRK